MTHDSAVQTVVSLVPDIEKRGAAEVLTEYAHKEDLPPAQLEKLGQVYNTLRTVSHIDNADKDARGSSVELLDVPVMVVGYATGADHEKAAAKPESVSSHDVRFLDLNKMLKRELSGGVEKAAAEQDVVATVDEVEDKFHGQVKRAEFETALLEIEVDLDDEMAKLAGEIVGAAPVDSDNVFLRDVSEFEEDALRRQPAALVKLAGDYLEKYADALRIKLTRFDHDQEIQKYAYDVPHEHGEKFAELAEISGTHDFIMKLAAADPTTQQEMLAHASPDSGLASMLGDVPTVEPEKKEEGEGGPDPDALAAEALEKGLTSDSESPGASGQDKRQPSSGGGEDKDSGGGSDKSSKGGGGSKSTGSRIAGAVAAPFVALGAGVRGAADQADQTLQKVVGKERQNKPQRAADIDVADIKRAMNLSRMIANDPVLKEADPKEIFEVYNSIVARNPEMAGDMAALRLVLREAVSYEGLTLDSQKMLSEIRRNDAQGAAAAEENEKKRYAVGGANPIQIAKA